MTGISGSSGSINLRPDLESFYELNVEMERESFIGDKVLPIMDVSLQADNPGKIPVEQLLTVGTTNRASGSGYGRGNWKFERWTYVTEEHGWEEPVDERDQNRYANLFDAETIALLRAQGVVARNYEARVAAAVFNSTTWTGASKTTAIVNEWDDFTNATPITDVEAAVQKVYDGSGLKANALVVNWKVFRNLRNCDQLLERIQSSGAGDRTLAKDVTAAKLAEAFDLEYVLVAGASKNSATEGQAASISQIWSSEYAMVCRISNSADMRDPCIGRTFHWTGDGSRRFGMVEDYLEPQTRSKIIRCRFETDEVIMYPEAGHLLSNITT